jgi:polar amino acid transport system substrate-binding protein
MSNRAYAKSRPCVALQSSTVFVVFACVLLGAALFSCREAPPEKVESPKAAAPKKPPVEMSKKQIEPTDNTIEAIKGRGEIRVGMQVGYIPFQMLDRNGELEGLDVDLARLVARSLKVSLRIVRQNWQELIPSLIDGKTDVIMSGMHVTPDRNSRVLFTTPVLESGRMFLVHTTNADRFKRLGDLNKPGIFVVSASDGLGELKLDTLLPRVSHREFPERKLALKEVMEKRAHAFIDEEFSIRLAAASHPESLVASFKPVTFEPIAWAVRPGDNHWLNWLDNFIRVIQKDGRLERLKKKWVQDYFLDIHSKPDLK